ncbi:type VI secretion system baseplate subunit TssF [Aquicoccus sp. G2-2]|uniref:type VI secretion system baseplate subunit TssF n=1 Tax=Aquicoccus sp. G2-2 TaxID=3092120 RepID=UPI002ADFD0D9|nr:type VI secretion system baseplate subunit TssF [Aquicoccus sp. G2-2]MEA1114686.1 type VI secretion system baseplate subunit TssF [Aquicoccus sp. G2-2]
MDRVFLEYYEEELSHIRGLAREFSAIHPNVARNLSIESTPCPDPYVERLLEGVAFLAARTRLKLDGEASRYVRNLVDALYPDLAGPGPAMSLAQLEAGPQVERMLNGHVLKRGTRVISGLREGLQTRCIYTTAQDVHLWPVEIAEAEYLQDQGTLNQAGVPEHLVRDAAAGLRLVIRRVGSGTLSELSLDSLDLFLNGDSRGAALFDAIFGFGAGVLARLNDRKQAHHATSRPRMVGISGDEALLPRVRASFEGYRLLREYFLMPERFYYSRLSGLSPALKDCTAENDTLEITLLLSEPSNELSSITASDFALHTVPLVNLFEHECDLVERRPGKASHIVHADRTRPRDFEIYRILHMEDAEEDGSQARIMPMFSVEHLGDSGVVYTTERRPRRPGEDEIRRGQTRTSYIGDDLYVAVARPGTAGPGKALPRRLDIRALCTNRDLPILDESPKLTLETGDPVKSVSLLAPFRRPRASLRSALPSGATNESRIDDLTWRWISQLSLNHLSLAAEDKDDEPLLALLRLYSDRGDPSLERHGRSILSVKSRAVVERLGIPGPLCFGHGTELTLEIDEQLLSGGSELLLSALLTQLFARHAGINSFVQTKTRLTQSQKEVAWPMTHGTRALI